MKNPKIKRIKFDDGSSKGDFNTGDNTLVLKGKAAPRAKVKIFDNGEFIGTVKANKKGKWKFETDKLEDGSHDFQIKAKASWDAVPTRSKVVSGDIDTDAPPTPAAGVSPASDTGISPSDGITADATPTLSGTAEAGATVTIRDGATVLGTAVADAAGNWVFTTSPLADGTHAITATASDKAGNASPASAVLTVVVDTAATGTIVLNAITPDNILNITEGAGDVTIGGTVTGEIPDGAVVTVTINGTDYTGTVAGGVFAIVVAGAVLLADADLTVSASVTASDVAGNTATFTDTQAYTLDQTAPTGAITITAIAVDDVVNIAESTGVIVVSGTVSGDVPDGATVTLTVNAKEFTGTVSSGAFSVDVPGSDLVADTGLEVTASVTIADAAGNTATLKDAHAYSLDLVAPTGVIVLDAVTADGVVNIAEGEGDVAITGTVTGDVPDGATVTLTVNGVEYTGAVASGAFSIDVPGSALLADGDLTVDASVTFSDAAGNEGSATDTEAYALDQEGPTGTIVLDAVTADDVINIAEGEDDVAISGTVSGAVPEGATVTLTVNGKEFTGTVSSGAFSIDVPGADLVADTGLSVSASVDFADAAGNPGSASDSAAYTLDQEAPAAATITGFSDDTGDVGDGVTEDTTLTLSGTAGAGLKVEIFDGTTSLGTTTADDNGDWTFDTDELEGGDHSFTAVAIDAAGNPAEASSALDVTIETSQVIDLTTLTAAQGFIIQGDEAGDRAGWSVSSAGDVNGDGYDDVIVGARQGDDGGTDAGEAYVVFGSARGFGSDVDGRQVIDLTSLTESQGFVIQGDAGGDYAGVSVSSAGDINGDGYDDLIVGAINGDDGGNNAGEAYVVFGSDSGFGTNVDGRQVIDLTSLSAAQGFIIQGDAAFDQSGASVSSAGDVNGDGYGDLIVGARLGDDGGSNSGEAYVIFGSASGFGTAVDGRQVIDLTSLSAAQGFIIQGDVGYDNAGWSVSSAGDVNGDGYADVIVGATGGDDGGSNSGEAYVVFGSASGFGSNVGGRQVIDLTSLSAAQGFIIQGDAEEDLAGYSVSSAGDINGDGYDDVIVGARKGDDGGDAAGEAYVVFGSASGFGSNVGGRQVIDLASLTAAEGFVIQGDARGDYVGVSVSSAGDVNGDGYDDLIVGASGGDNGGSSAGEAYVIFGSASGFGTAVNGRQVLDLSTLTAAQGFIIQGDAASDNAGRSVSAAGDINGDGYDDLIVGAPYGDDGGSNAGEAYVVYGGAFGGSLEPVTTTGNAGAEMLIGGAGDDTLSGGGGADVIRSGAGDDTITVDDLSFRKIDGGTGSDTLLLGGAGLSLDLTDRVQAARIDGIERIDLGGGGNTLVVDKLAVLNETPAREGKHILTVRGSTGSVEVSEQGWKQAGTITVGDTTYDRYRNGDAELRVEQGVAVTLPPVVIDLSTLTAAQGFIIQGDAAVDQVGFSVSSAGDVNGDGYADIIVGAHLGDDGGTYAGEAYVVFGSASGFGTDVGGRQVIDLTSISAAQGFIIQGDAASDYAGFSVSSAGDINGDGYDDLIVGATGGDDGGSIAGEAYVIFGSSSGFGTAVGGRQVIDLTSLSAAQGFIIQGDAEADQAGYSVSSAGDINGDGYDDLIVGARQGDDGGSSAGEAYVVFGSASGFGSNVGGRQVVDLSSLSAAQGFIIQGDAAGDQAGFSVSSAGDVNGDGYGDLIVGGQGGDDGGTAAGEAYVIFGSASGFGSNVGGRQVIDLTSLTAAQGFIIQGDAEGDNAGFSVSGAGDVNGDGYDDLIVGASGGDDGGDIAGEAYVVFGSASGFGTDVGGRQVIDLTSLTAAQGFIIQGDTGGDFTGRSVSSAGDVNGDGFGDLIVGAPRADDGGTDAGEAYVIFGSASGFGTDVDGRQVIDLTDLTAAQGFIIQGDAANDFAGRSVSAAGDVNGDGYDDLIVGAPYGDDGGTSAGEAYVVYGGAFGSSTNPVTTTGTGSAEMLIGGAGDDVLSGGGGIDVIYGGAGGDTITVADLSFLRVDGGSGSDTLVLGGTGLSLDLTDRVQAARIDGIEAIDLGGNGNTLVLDKLAVLNETPADGDGAHVVTVLGGATDTVSLDGNGWILTGTVVVGTTTFDRYVDGNAEVRIAQGVTVDVFLPAPIIDLTTLTAAQGFIIRGDAGGEQAGWSVSSAGDVNGDGYDDLIVGAPSGADGGSAAGEAYVVFGSASGFGTDVGGRQVIDLTSLTASEGFIIQGDEGNDRAGWSVSSAGDVNGDGYDDIVVGAKYGNDGGRYASEAYVIFGSASGFGTDVGGRQVIDLTSLTAAQGFIVQGDEEGDWAGISVSSAGDVNGDGYDDLIVGAIHGDDGGENVGEAYVVFGSGSGFGTDVDGRQVIDLTSLTAAEGFIIQGDATRDYAGWSVSSAGDVNGDGYGDLIVGAIHGDDGGTNAGEAYVVFGSGSGFGTAVGGRQVIDLTSLTAAEGFIIQGDAAGDYAGISVSSAGDVNGDGYDDLIIGAQGGDDGGYSAGEAYVVFGSASGFGTDVGGRQVIDLTSLSAAQGFIIQGDAAGDQAGFSVSSAGDVNGDGFDDLIVGAVYSDAGGSYSGQAYVIFGSASGFGTDVDGRQVIDLSSLSAAEGFIIQGDAAGDYAGRSVSSAGDVNGNGFDDLIVGAPFGDSAGSGAGEAYVVYGGTFGGSLEPIEKGVAYGDGLAGGPGDDTLYGFLGTDYGVYIAGAGDDTITNTNLAFTKLDGGGGTDTLILNGVGKTLDLTDRLMAARIDGIEHYNLVGNGNTLIVDKLAVLNETPANADGVHVLTVLGSDAAMLNFADSGWSLAGTVTEGGVTYDRYVDGNAEVRVQQGVAVTIPPTVIDLATLSEAQGFIIQGDAAGDMAGWSVSSAGDVNGDGYDDMIVGAPRSDSGGNNAGESYVIFGSGSGFGTNVDGRQVIDLSTLPAAQGFVIRGDAAFDQVGRSVSSAGDVNGDGYDDLIVGAFSGDDGGDGAGEAYVVFGSGSGFGTAIDGRQVIDLTTLTAAQGFVIQGVDASDLTGISVSAAGDVNGDGYDDLIVGAPYADDGGSATGAAHVVFGSASGFGTNVGGRQVIDLAVLTAAEGFVIRGDSADDRAGWSVSSAGDVNGDGYDDLIVGARLGDDGGTSAGEAYVVFGSGSGFGTAIDGRQVIALDALTAAQGFVIQGDKAGDQAGGSVSSAGDVNGDGYDDLIVGARQSDNGGNNAGEAYVVFGSASGFGTDVGGRQVLDLTTLTAAQGFIIQGDAAGDFAGISVSSAGDINGDGYDDLIVGAAYGDAGGSYSGQAYVIFGSASGFGTAVDGRQVIDLTNLTAAQGFIIAGDAAGDYAGYSVSAAGDVDGDGYADLILGAKQGDDGGENAGEAYIVYGGAFGSSTSPVTTTGTADAEILIGGAGDDDLSGGGGADVIRSGAGNDTITVADVGFLKIDGGTGSDTLVLGGSGLTLDLSDPLVAAKVDAIEAIDLGGGGNTLVLDKLAVLNETPAASDGTHVVTVTGDDADTVSLTGGGWSLAGTIVVDTVTYDRYVSGNAEVRVQQGVAATIPPLVIDLATLSEGQGFVIQGDTAGDMAGWSVSSAGDVNGDGYADVIIGTLNGGDGGFGAGEAYVIFGSASGFGTDVGGRQVVDLTTLTPTQGFIIQGDAASDYAGFSVSSAGDINGDGYDDLIVGAKWGDDGALNAGEAYVVFGSASGFGTDVAGRQVIDLTSLSAAQGFIIQGDAAGDYAGFSVSSAGDVNGDGYDDLIIGAKGGGDGGYGAGEAYVVFGSAAGFGLDVDGRQVVDLTTLTPDQGFIIQGAAIVDRTGAGVGSADVNGDGYADLIVGAPYGDAGGDYSGQAYVIFGAASGIGSEVDGRQVLDLATLTADRGFMIAGAAGFDLTGASVSSAGDVNGDGYEDLIIGADSADGVAENSGIAYVVFGSGTGFGVDVDGRQVIDLATLDATQGFLVSGAALSDNAGRSVSGAGDVNGDGYDDIIVGVPLTDEAGTDTGSAYVIFGKASGFGVEVGGRQVIDLGSLSPAQGFIIQGAAGGDITGRSVSAAGDINGDGYDDLIVGAPYGDDGGSNAGGAYVVYGGAFGGSLDPVTTEGNGAAEILIGGAGDDVLSGGGGADVIRSGAGNDTITVADVGFLKIDGGTGSDTLVLGGSGLTLDLSDPLVAAKVDAIEAIDLGGGGNTLVVDTLAVLNETPAASDGTHVVTVTGDDADTVSLTGDGWSLAGTIVVDTVTYDRYVSGNAEVRVQQGVVVDGLPVLPTVIDLATLTAAEGFVIQGHAAGDYAGWSVSSAGDVNGDGFDDIIVGAWAGDGGAYNAGEAYVVFGSASGFGADVGGRQVLDLTSLSAAEGFVILGDAVYDNAGFSVSSAGDVNGDGYDDLIVGAPYGNDGGSNAGEAYVVFGSASGFGTDVGGRQVIDLTSLTAAEGFVIQGDALYDSAGYSVSSAGDVNGDGYGDLIVGARSGADGGNSAGEAYVVFGSASGFGSDVGGRQVIDLTSLSAAQGFVIQGDTASDLAGISVSSAGDVNGDGYDDLIVGGQGGDDGGNSAGEAYVVFGSASGFGTDVAGRQVIDLTSLSAAQGFIIQGDSEGDYAGFSVSGAGDVNGDGYDDLIVGASGGDDGGDTGGEAYVIFGSASGFGTDVGGRQVIDLTSLTAAQGFIIQGVAAGDFSGRSVSSAGDVNGDGYDDLIVGAPGNNDNDGGDYSGAAYVIFGTASGFGTDVDGRQVIDLGSLSPSQGFIIDGAAEDKAGWSVSAAGDINGDGYDDLSVGAPFGDDGGENAGEAYIVYGGAFGGSLDPVTTIGTGSAEILIGGAGDDLLRGGGGADVIRSGAGDDTIAVTDLAFRKIDGGTGTDTLMLWGSGLSLDLTDRVQAAKVDGIEAIHLGGRGNTLVLDPLAVLNELPASGDGPHVVTVLGGATDAVSLAGDGWSLAGTVVVGTTTFDRYVSGNAEVRVQQGVVVLAPVIDLSALSAAEGFIIQGETAGDQAGFSVSWAGDVNGDGYADLIVGAVDGDDGGNRAGEAYVVFGSGSGFGTDVDGRQVIDLTSLTAAQGFIIQGDAAGDWTGWSVAGAGDVNGDGFDDLIVGAIGGDDAGYNAGEAYVVFGSGSGFGTDVVGRQVIDLTNLSAAQGFIIQGDEAEDAAGRSVSSAGDVNGDGFDDLIVAAVFGDDAGEDAGEAYVVFGSASGFGTAVGGRQVIDLTSLSAAQGFIIQGDAADDRAGISVSSAGDVNGDGYGDVIVGASWGDDGGDNAGEAYVIFGSASGFGTDVGGPQVIDLTSLTAAEGVVIQGHDDHDWAGVSVSSAGDVNGDGYDDLIIGAIYGGISGTVGEAYVVFGSASGFGADVGGRQVIDLTTLSAAEGFVIEGVGAYDYAGQSVSSAGDVNGDGYDDLIVGAPGNDDGGTYAGQTYVVFGSGSGFGKDVDGRQVIDLGSLGEDQGFIIRGASGYDYSGRSVSAAGDVNGDGYDDLIVGAPQNDDGGENAGQAYVVYGGAFGGSLDPVTTTGTSDPEILIGGAGDDVLSGGGGADVIRSGAGDDTITVGDLAFHKIDGGTGTDTLVLGGAALTLDLTDRVQAAKIDGIEAIDLGGGGNTLTLDQLAVRNETPASDGGTHVLTVSGDATDTVSLAGDGWTLAGTIVVDTVTFDRYVDGNVEVRVQQGVAVTIPPLVIDLATLGEAQGFVIQGDADNDNAGYDVSWAGDVNGDGYADIIVGARQGDDGGYNAGEAYVIFGSGSGFGMDVDGRQVIDLATLTAAQGFIIQGDDAEDQASRSVSSAGDVNGDGYDDLIVGAPKGDDGGSDAGAAYVVFGSGSGFGTDAGGRQVIDLASLTAAEGFIIQGDTADDFAGYSVSSAGDVNGDGYGDLIVGARSGDDGGNSAGEAYVVFGSASGFGTDVGGRQVIDLTGLTAAQGFIIQGDEADDAAGRSVSSAGDVNGDGYDDLIVAAMGGDGGGAEAGEAYVIFGSASGFGTSVGVRQVIDLTSLSAAQGFIIQGDAVDDRAGWSVSSAGDINGDGYDDMIVGAPFGDDGADAAGEAYVVFGSASGFGTSDGVRQVIDLTSLSAAQGFIIQGDAVDDRVGLGVSSAGDINGDGYDDLIVGVPYSDGREEYTGVVYVVFGSGTGFGHDAGGRQVIDLAGLQGGDGLTILGDGYGGNSGFSVSSAGDVNGDGFDDLIVGAKYGDDGGYNAGQAYVVYGGAFGGSLDPVTTTGNGTAEMLIGGAGDDALSGGGGADVIRSGAGDDTITVGDLAFHKIDGGTGTDTLVLGGSALSLDLTDRVQAAKIDGIEAIDLGGGANTLTLDKLAVLNETPASDGGTHVLTVSGDATDTVSLTGDGWSLAGTIVVDTVTFDRYVDGTAEVRVQQGVAVTSLIELATITEEQGFVIDGVQGYSQFGMSVSDAGDVNGDGLGDFIIGAPAYDASYVNDGAAYVVFGSTSGFGTDVDGRQVIDVADLSAAEGFLIRGARDGDRAGYSVSSAGDVNGDGYDDLIVGAPSPSSNNPGAAYIVFGSGSGFGTAVGVQQVVDLATLSPTEGFVIQDDDDLARAGVGVSSAGDVNGDGYDDLIVGARKGATDETVTGEAYVVFGSPSAFGAGVDGRQVLNLGSLSAGEGFVIRGAVGSGAGWSVASAGDLNGDGYADILVGAPDADDGSNIGETYVVFGSGSGFGIDVDGRQVIDGATLGAAEGFVIRGGAAADYSGWSVSTAGDVNGDGYDDLIIGAQSAGGAEKFGEAYVVFGSDAGFGADVGGRQVVDLGTLTPDQGIVIRGANADDRLGIGVSGAGDVNGDGFDDIIVGADYADVLGNADGAAYVIFGAAEGIGTLAGGRQIVDVTALVPGEGVTIVGGAEWGGAGWSVSSAGDVNGDGFDDVMLGAHTAANSSGEYSGSAYVVYGGAFGGSLDPVTITGTSDPEILIGGAGDDVLSGGGGGGADVIRSGAGNDTITVTDLAFFRIDGGTGTDTLHFAGPDTGLTIDFTTATKGWITGIEAIDTTSLGDDIITLGALDVLDFSETIDAAFTGAASHRGLVFRGNGGDVLHLDDYSPPAGSAYAWVTGSSDIHLDGTPGGDYDTYDLMRDGKVVATVAVESDVTVMLSP